MRFFLLFLFLLTSLYSWNEAKAEKSLRSLDRAQTYSQNLIKKGFFEDADRFLALARKKYKNDSELFYWSGELYLEKAELEKSNKYFRLSLKFDPKNVQAKKKIKLIEEQIDAEENKDVLAVLEILSDKGLDFIMIFLAFLGSEIIAKRFTKCNNNAVYIMANHYIYRDELVKSFLKRVHFFILNLFPRKRPNVICLLINLLITATIAISMLTPFLYIEFHYELSWWGLPEPLVTMDLAAIEKHVALWFLFFLMLSVFYTLGTRFLRLKRDKEMYAIELVEELDNLYAITAYTDVAEVLKHLQKYGVSREEITSLLDRYSQYKDEISQFYIDNKGVN